MEPSLKPDANSVTFIIWSAISLINMILLYPIWSVLCLNGFINYSLSASSVFICLFNSTFILFDIFSSCCIESLISSYFISCLSGNPAFYFVSLHDFIVTQLLSIYLLRRTFSSLRSCSHLRISFSNFFSNHGFLRIMNFCPPSAVAFLQTYYHGSWCPPGLVS